MRPRKVGYSGHTLGGSSAIRRASLAAITAGEAKLAHSSLQ
jgi:hypothetical protein